MADQTDTPASSAGEIEDVFQGRNDVGVVEFTRSRFPEKFTAAEPAESVPADTPKGAESGNAGEADSPKDQTQEKPGRRPHLNAEQRTAQIESKIQQLWDDPEPDVVRIAQLESTKDRIAAGKRKTEPAPVAPAQPQPQLQPQVQAQPQYTRPEPAVQDLNPDGTPKYSDYEQYVKAQARWEVEQELAERDRRQLEQAQAQRITAKVEEARTRYGDEFESVIVPTWNEIWSNPAIHADFKNIMAQSELVPDVMHKLGTDSQAKEKFFRMAQSAPIDALKYIGALEHEIATQKPDTIRNEKGQFAAPEPPAKTRTSAPKPPSPVGGGSARGAFDANDFTGSNEEWARQRNADVERKRRAGY